MIQVRYNSKYFIFNYMHKYIRGYYMYTTFTSTFVSVYIILQIIVSSINTILYQFGSILTGHKGEKLAH